MKDNGSAQDCRHKENYIGRQTRVTRETQLEPLKQWLRNKMGGDGQSTWEHMAPNKQQAMCSTDRDIWWPAWAHQQDRDSSCTSSEHFYFEELLFLIHYIQNNNIRHFTPLHFLKTCHASKFCHLYSPSCRSKPVTLSFIFGTQIKIFLLKSESFLTLRRQQSNWKV